MAEVKSYPKEKDKPKKKIGRPSSYKKELGDIICNRLANGESLRSICRDEGMPDRMQVIDWTILHENFGLQYARARELQAESLVDDILQIADDTTDDDIFTEQGNRIANNEWIARSKVRMEARKWIASKILPKKYGDKLEVDNKGEVGLNITVKHYAEVKDE